MKKGEVKIGAEVVHDGGETSNADMLIANMIEFCATKGKNVTVLPCTVNGIETAAAFAMVRQRVETEEDADGNVQVAVAMVPLFIQVTDAMDITVLPSPESGADMREQRKISTNEMRTIFDTEGNA